MHDLEFNHMHVALGEEINEIAWTADNVELRTVGIDIGSSTSHLMFSLVHLQRLGTALSSRFVVVDRKTIWQSPILLTPYLPDFTIDIDELAGFISGCYRYADVDPADVDSGAIILTGEAIKRRNARAIAEIFSEDAGRFVCASAGHHMECQLSAQGSGAVALSRGHGATLLNVDIGGGTTKLSIIEKGQVLATAAIAIGGRLIVENSKSGLVRIEEPALKVAKSLDIPLELGGSLVGQNRSRLVTRMGRLIMSVIDFREPNDLARDLMVTDPWPKHLANTSVDAITFSGGIAEYLFKRETRRFGDIGFELAHELAHLLGRRRDLPPVWDPGQGIRATVIGAAQFSMQTSGNTISISKPDDLPLRNLAVSLCDFELGAEVDPASITATVCERLLEADIEEGSEPLAFTFAWHGDPSHRRLHALAAGLCAALPRTIAAGIPLVLLIDGDIAMTLGRIIRTEIDANSNIVAIDGVQLKQFDYVDIGEVIEVTDVVPIVIKSLLFN